ncbi:MAG: hypothetical protein IIB61_05935 [Planctomycetes bacterium]|nr:hypothetical protein [Planctomycetota bacterium]
MIDARHVPDVEEDELLARFVLYSRHIRGSTDGIKPEAFMPHHNELSVTRHRDATEDEVWSAGRAIANLRQRTLHGRGDVLANAFIKQDLSVQAAPLIDDASLPDNPNHANVTGWPDDKARQRQRALEIAAQTKLVRPSDQ